MRLEQSESRGAGREEGRTKSEQWRRHQITFHLEGLLEELWLFLRYLGGFGFLKIFICLVALGLTCGMWGLCCSMWDLFFFLSCSMQNL